MSAPLTYQRLAGRFPPERELLEVDAEGQARVWRSYGAAAAGRFAGPSGDHLAPLVEAALAAGVPRAAQVPPDGSEETIDVGDQHVELASDDGDGPWGRLAQACRDLTASLVDAPVAAVALVPVGPRQVRLEHRGDEILPIELASLRVSVTQWRDGLEAARGTGLAPPGAGHVDAGKGWQLDIPVEGPDLVEGALVTATATFVVVDDGVFVPVHLTGRL